MPQISPDTTLRVTASVIDFEAPQWASQYYPDNCPSDWRIAYFMNDFSSVYLPHSTWFNQANFIDALQQELEPGFDLVIELPPLNKAKVITEVLRQLLPLNRNIVCCVIQAKANMNKSQLAFLSKALLRFSAYAINIDCAKMLPEKSLINLAEKYKAGFVWHVQHHDAPFSHVAYQVMRLPDIKLRTLMPLLKKLSPQNSSSKLAGIFFNPFEQCTLKAKETRTLLELLDIA